MDNRPASGASNLNLLHTSPRNLQADQSSFDVDDLQRKASTLSIDAVSGPLSGGSSNVTAHDDKVMTVEEQTVVQSTVATPFYTYHTDRIIEQDDMHTVIAGHQQAQQQLLSQQEDTMSQSQQGGPRAHTRHATSAETGVSEQQSVMTASLAQGVAVVTDSLAVDNELAPVYAMLAECIGKRERYMELSMQHDGHENRKDTAAYQPYPVPDGMSVNQGLQPLVIDVAKLPGNDEQLTYQLSEDGVYQVFDAHDATAPKFEVPTIREYFRDLDQILGVISDGPTKSVAFRRLRYLESKFQMHTLLNEFQEQAQSKAVAHRDFYNVRKVDTHVHHSSCMNQKHLLRYIKSKLKKCPQDIVIYRDNKYLTLAQVFESLKLTAYDLSIDTLDMHAHNDSFHRFDKFNLKYNPIGESRLREIFLKTDNLIAGRYLAELTREVISDLEASKYQMAEYRISVYGRSPHEWDKIATWVCNNNLFSPNVRWLVQIPRLYGLYKQKNEVQSFEDMVTNIFKPLFEVTRNPSSHPQLHVFLQRVVGFDSVDDESKSERRIHRKYPVPRLWNFTMNPPYAYYIYYMYANLCSLNQWRHARAMNTFVLRPHAGEAGDTDHLTATFLTSIHISHGILLRKVPALQYLIYLEQVGLAMSPLSNNALFINYERNPFPSFFRIGLNVSLSTDDPLQFHFTREPLIEEYSVAAQIWRLTPTDMCELARNSVLQSGWESEYKRKWLGANYRLAGVAGNDVHKTNVPDLRARYRHDTLQAERRLVLGALAGEP